MERTAALDFNQGHVLFLSHKSKCSEGKRAVPYDWRDQSRVNQQGCLNSIPAPHFLARALCANGGVGKGTRGSHESHG